MKACNTIMISIILAALFMFAPVAFATPRAALFYFETEVDKGWQYDYTFHNTSDAGEDLYGIIFGFSQVESTTGLPLPEGWGGTLWEGNNSSALLVAKSQEPINDIAPGSSKNGFSFISKNRVGDIDFYAQFVDGGSNFQNITSVTAVAPEPISSVLFLIGGTTLAARSWYRRKRKTS